MSLVCAVHCAATPVLVGALPLIGHQFEQVHWVEGPLVGAAACLGYLTLGLRYRLHGRAHPLVLLTLGLCLLALAHLLLPAERSLPATLTGGLLMAGAQLLDRRYGGRCCPGHQQATADPLIR
jgi:hypothetical protein